MSRSKRISAFLLCLLMLFLLPKAGFAAGSIDMEQPLTLRLSFQDGKTPLVGASFSLYQVATADETGELTATAAFQSKFVNIRGEDDEAWRAQALTLESYVLRDALPPLDSGKTDKNGDLSFPTNGKKLTPGLYLVRGERHEQGGTRYDPVPFLVMLPTIDMEENVWAYVVEVSGKYASALIPSQPDTVERKVLKVWKDDGNEANRPSSIKVHLLRNGVLYDTVTLTQANNWRYSWEKLDASYRWTIAEADVSGYTATVTQNGITFVITNTSGAPSSSAPEQPGGKPGKPSKPNLPQTGQLWWPVPLLLCAGLISMIVGILRRRRMDDER